ncbi:22943_t:CDS:2, partial [Cetraspora pellucida]
LEVINIDSITSSKLISTLYYPRYSIAEWKEAIDNSKYEINALIKVVNSLESEEKKNLLTAGKENCLKRLKNKFQKMKGSDKLLIPFMVEGENIQQIFATMIDYDDFKALIYKRIFLRS